MLITLFWFLQNSSAKSSLIQFHVLTCNHDGFRPFKMAKRNTFLWKKKKNIKIMNFAFIKVIFQSSKEKKNSDRIFSLAWNIVYWLLKSHCFQFFGDGKYGLFWAKKIMEIWYLLITENFLFWTFQEWEIRSFFEAKSWWKDDIYQLLKSSCFELFHDGKCSLFLGQKVNGKMIFTDYWKVHILGYRKVVLGFSVMGNTVFFKPKSWCKGNIYLVFLSFPWYSRTWEIRFFVQWKYEYSMEKVCFDLLKITTKFLSLKDWN